MWALDEPRPLHLYTHLQIVIYSDEWIMKQGLWIICFYIFFIKFTSTQYEICILNVFILELYQSLGWSCVICYFKKSITELYCFIQLHFSLRMYRHLTGCRGEADRQFDCLARGRESKGELTETSFLKAGKEPSWWQCPPIFVQGLQFIIGDDEPNTVQKTSPGMDGKDANFPYKKVHSTIMRIYRSYPVGLSVAGDILGWNPWFTFLFSYWI